MSSGGDSGTQRRPTVLVTGASGFIGGRVAERLVADGYTVRAMVRPSSQLDHLRTLTRLQFAQGDLTDTANLPAVVEGVDLVVHCAAMVSDWGTVEEIRAINTDGAADLARAASAAGVRRFVQISSTDIYGHPGGRGIQEDHQPSGFANWYAQTKREAEAALARIASEAGMELVIVRPATVYGPRSTEVVGELATALKGGYLPLIDGGRAIAGLVYVDNLVDAIELALTRPEAVGEAFNISDGLDVTWRQFFNDLAAALGVRPPWLRLHGGLAMGLGEVMERGYRAARRRTGLQVPPLLSRQAVQVLVRDQDFSHAKLSALLGWEPRISYEQGMAVTVGWLQEEYFTRD